MKTMVTKIKTLTARCLLCCGIAAALVSCSNDWNDHYDVASINSGTLWQAIEADGNLSNFARVVKACGYDQILNGSQTFSVFAPTNAALSVAEADSLVSVYQQQAAAGTRSDDNTVVRQFLQNHIALFKQPVSSLTNDSITLMNSKYAVITANSIAGRHLLSANALYNNGLLFTVDQKMDYFPNVFEYLGHDSDLDSVYLFLNRYSVYEFNDAKSVPGEIVDGLTIYLDSVSELYNTLFDSYGLINSEDSTYWFLAPTNSEWSRLVTEYEPYFNYPNTVAKRDSMVYTNARLAIIGGAFFSRTQNPDEAFGDSAVSTMAPSALARTLLDMDYPYYTYYRPFDAGGIFDGTTDVVCSNGHVRKASSYNLSKYQTFMQTIKVEAENILYQDTIIDAVDPLVVREVTSDNPFYGKVSGNSFVEVIPDPATAQVTVSFKIPSVLSGVKYDIYAVFVPATAYDTLAISETTKPNIVRTTIYWNDQNGKEARRIFNRNISNQPDVVDTLLLAEAFTFPTCSYGLAEPQARVQLKSNVSSKQTATNSSTLRLDCIILKPTEE